MHPGLFHWFTNLLRAITKYTTILLKSRSCLSDTPSVYMGSIGAIHASTSSNVKTALTPPSQNVSTFHSDSQAKDVTSNLCVNMVNVKFYYSSVGPKTFTHWTRSTFFLTQELSGDDTMVFLGQASSDTSGHLSRKAVFLKQVFGKVLHSKLAHNTCQESSTLCLMFICS